MNPRFHNMKRLRTKTPTSLRQPSFAEAALLRMVLEARALGAVVVLGAIFAVGFVATTSVAQEVIVQEVINPDREASVKAVFLYSYGRYVTWPATFPAKGGPGKIEDDFVIGVLGDSAVIDKLERIAKKRTISGRPIRLLRVESPAKIPPCHILYVAGYADENRQKVIVDATAGQPLLLVGESNGFAERGAAINFYVSGNRIRFQINAETVHQRGLQLDAQLLNLGDRVGGPPVN